MQILCLVTPWWHLSQRRHPGGQAEPLKAAGHSQACRRPARTIRTTKVVLATAHLGHNPSNNSPRNLKALCQRCHMLHDREEHRRRRRIALRKRNALGNLFLGRYSDFA